MIPIHWNRFFTAHRLEQWNEPARKNDDDDDEEDNVGVDETQTKRKEKKTALC